MRARGETQLLNLLWDGTLLRDEAQENEVGSLSSL